MLTIVDLQRSSLIEKYLNGEEKERKRIYYWSNRVLVESHICFIQLLNMRSTYFGTSKFLIPDYYLDAKSVV